MRWLLLMLVAALVAYAFYALHRHASAEREKRHYEYIKARHKEKLQVFAEAQAGQRSRSTKNTVPRPPPANVKPTYWLPRKEENHIAQAKETYHNTMVNRSRSPFPLSTFNPDYNALVRLPPIMNWEPKVLKDLFIPGIDYIPPPAPEQPRILTIQHVPVVAPPVIAAPQFTQEQLDKAAEYLTTFRADMKMKVLAIPFSKSNPSEVLHLAGELTDIINKVLPDARILAKEANNIADLRNYLDYPLEALVDMLVMFDKEPSLAPEIVTLSKLALELFELLGGSRDQIASRAPAPVAPENTATAATTGKPFSVSVGGHTFSRDPVPETGAAASSVAEGPSKKRRAREEEEAKANEVVSWDEMFKLAGEKKDDKGKKRVLGNSRLGGRNQPY